YQTRINSPLGIAPGHFVFLKPIMLLKPWRIPATGPMLWNRRKTVSRRVVTWNDIASGRSTTGDGASPGVLFLPIMLGPVFCQHGAPDSSPRGSSSWCSRRLPQSGGHYPFSDIDSDAPGGPSACDR